MNPTLNQVWARVGNWWVWVMRHHAVPAGVCWWVLVLVVLVVLMLRVVLRNVAEGGSATVRAPCMCACVLTCWPTTFGILLHADAEDEEEDFLSMFIDDLASGTF